LADFGADLELGRLLLHFHNNSKPTAAICHGPYAFLSVAKAGDGSFAHRGYKLISWSDLEEHMMELMFGADIEKVESSLRAAGADMQEGLKEKVGGITVDREVVSGGNPMAAGPLGDQFLTMLKV
jgi:putative intracellular protease/amidase